MDLQEGIADLHLHTVASDGTATVSERAKQAQEEGLEGIAVTDHDTIPETINTRVT